EGFLPLGEMWHSGGKPGQPEANMRLPRVARQAPSGAIQSHFALVQGGALGRRDSGGRVGGTFGDPSVGDHPLCPPRDRQDQVTLVVCDHLPVLARGLAKLLEEEAPNLRVAGVEVSLQEAKRSIAELRPAVALVG